MHRSLRPLLWSLLALFFVFTAIGCEQPPSELVPEPTEDFVWEEGGKGDELFAREYEVLFTDPFCDRCFPEDRDVLRENSQIVARVVELIDGAREQVDVAQFTFSDRRIEEALYRANARGVQVRVAMDHGQEREGSLSQRMLENGMNVRFVRGNEVGSQDRYGLMHSKFMIVDGTTLLSGSNNWSSTGTSLNEENTIIVHSEANDTLILAFACHFMAAWEQAPETSSSCSTHDARFSPGVAGRNLIRDGIRASRSSVDVLMHHFLFEDLLRELVRAADRGVKVRIIMNYEDREHYQGGRWDELFAAGGELRFKQNNVEVFQIMHHKLAIIDGQTLLHGSGNWSGSGFFNNYEFYVRYRHPEVVYPFNQLFSRLWDWSLSFETIDRGINAARQHHESHRTFFGNLHAHYQMEGEDGKFWDDGELMRMGDDGELYSVVDEIGDRSVAQYAFEYARDRGGMDFMALSPHVVDFRVSDPVSDPNLTPEGYREILDVAARVNRESQGRFVAIPSMEWNTLSNGNHVNIFGSRALSQVERGRFDVLYEEFLPGRIPEGDRPLLQFNHPRTFSQTEGALSGNWDQIFDVNLLEISSDSQRGRKFTDYGLNYYPPLSEVHQSWIEGEAIPSREVVSETMRNLDQVTRGFARMMEVTIGRGTDIAHEHGENPSWVERDGEPWHYTRVESDWHYYLLHGFRLAPTANHDNHYANWGTGHSSRTAIIAPELSERALLDAMDRRLVYASEDQNLAVALYADGRIPMGSEHGTTASHVNLQLYFEDPDYQGSYEVKVMLGRIGDEEVQTRTHMRDVRPDRWHGLTVPLPEAGEYFVYVNINKVDSKRMAWTAPIWITRY